MLERQRLDELTNNVQVSILGYTDVFGDVHIGGFIPVLKHQAKTKQKPSKFEIKTTIISILNLGNNWLPKEL